MTVEGEHNAVVRTLSYEANARQGGDAAYQFGFVGLKLLGLYLILQITRASMVLMRIVLDGSNKTFPYNTLLEIVAFVLPIVLDFLIGVVLFWFARPLASRLFLDRSVRSSPLTRHDSMSLILSGVGLFMVCSAFPGLCACAANTLSEMLKAGVTFGTAIDYSIVNWVSCSVQTLLGLFLFFFARFLTGTWQRLSFRPPAA